MKPKVSKNEKFRIDCDDDCLVHRLLLARVEQDYMKGGEY